MFLGRAGERARLDAVLDAARAGRGEALVVSGEAGVGKTALLEQVVAGGSDLRVVRGSGIESEIELPFAFLHLLLHPHLDRLAALPAGQARALRAALGLAEGGAGEEFLLGLATLSLLADLADERPVLCVVDDAQWIDEVSARALLFAARRLGHAPVALVFAVRPDAQRFGRPGIEVLSLPALARADAETLLHAHARRVAGPTRARILAEARGNPLAIIEFSAAVSEHRGAHSTPVAPLPVVGRVREAFGEQIDALPAPTQRMLQVTAADDTSDVDVVHAAGALLGLAPADLEPAVAARLVDLAGGAVTFRHPLIRAAAYRPERREALAEVHIALADAHRDDPDRRAWHRAAAATGPDEDVAAALERAAHRAARRGGTASAATALARAAGLSVAPERRGERLVAAARAAFDAGGLEHAARLAGEGAPLVDDPATRAEAAWIEAQVAYELDSPAAAADLAVRGARRVVDSAPERAASMLCDAGGCAKDACRPDLLRLCADVLGPLVLQPDSTLAPVRDGMIGLADWSEAPRPGAVAAMRRLVAATRDGRVDGRVERVLGGYLALIVGDDDDAVTVLDALAGEVRAHGAVGWLPYAHEPLAIAHLLAGRPRDAEVAVTEALEIATELGQRTQAAILTAIPAWLAAVGGDAERCAALAATARTRTGHPTNAALAAWALGLSDLARGRFDAAAEHLATVVRGPARHDFLLRATPDLVEAGVRGGAAARSTAPDVEVLERWADDTGHPHAAGLVARCRALLTSGPDAERHYREAAERHERAGRRYDAARTALVFGEWLRRERRRAEARTHLGAALGAFEGLGAHAFAARAELKLRALGDRPTARASDRDPLARLSPQERQVVQLAATGLTNREVAAQLFLSHRTVEHHLHRAYAKLGVGGRRDLVALASSAAAAP